MYNLGKFANNSNSRNFTVSRVYENAQQCDSYRQDNGSVKIFNYRLLETVCFLKELIEDRANNLFELVLMHSSLYFVLFQLKYILQVVVFELNCRNGAVFNELPGYILSQCSVRNFQEKKKKKKQFLSEICRPKIIRVN